MKIVYLTHDMNPKAGWGRYASDLIYGIKNAGYKVVILKEQDDGFEGIPVLKRKLGIFISALKIRKFIKDCDIVHALDGYPYGITAWLANIGLGKKLIISVQGTYSIAPLYNPKSYFLLKQAYKKANKIIAISRYTEGELLKKIALTNTQVINHGVDLKKFYCDSIESEDNFILGIGALKFRKGYHVSIPAFALVKKKMPKIKYKIVGNHKDKIYHQHLQKITKENGVSNDVEFLDNLSDEELKKTYSQAKLFILTSVNHNHHFEGFGLVFLEAAAAGLPVIGTRGNGIVDAIKDGYNGTLVNQDDIGGTAEALKSMLRDKDKRLVMSKNSYDWAKKNGIDSMIRKYLNVYQNI